MCLDGRETERTLQPPLLKNIIMSNALLRMTDFKKLNPEGKSKCLILGCGPSLSKINEDQIKKLSKDHLIVTIKQSYLRFGEYSDLQFFNCNNIIKYERKKAKFICCSPDTQSSRRWGSQEIDEFFHIKNRAKKLKDFENTEDFFQKEEVGKHLGPGIMVEVVIPLIYNLGIKEIITAGWDYHKNEQEIEHFYEELDRKKFGNPANIPYRGENEESIENSGKINSFLASKGVSLCCLGSDKCFLHESIKRINVN